MDNYIAHITAIGRLPRGAPQVRIRCSEAAIPEAGQPMLAYPLGTESFQRFTLYPSEILEDGFRCPLPEQENWQPGDQINVLGPIGRGYSPPAKAKRWLLMSEASHFSPLLPLLKLAEENGAAVVLVGRQHPTQLPASVEVLSEPEPALDWADYAAISLPWAKLSQLKARFGRYRDLPLPCSAQVLLHDPLPCGFGGCLCCGLPSGSHLTLRCRQGPVFNWDQLHV